MGWWHGHLLAEPIRELGRGWSAVLLAAASGASGGEPANRISERLALYVDQVRHRLPERLRQELEGMAAGSGVTAEELLRLEVTRDALRLEGLEPRLFGALAASRSPKQGLEAWAWWAGPDLPVLSGHWILVERHPTDGTAATACVAWPGALGALAGTRADGLAAAAVEVQVLERTRLGFGGGQPFSISLRTAIEESPDVDALLARARGTTGHGLLALEEPGAQARHVGGAASPRAATVLVTDVGGDDPAWLRAADLIAFGPHGERERVLAQRLLREVSATEVPLAERLRRVRAHADGDPDTTAHAGPTLRLSFEAGRAQLSFTAPASAATRTVTLVGR